jgi:MFS family permease
VLAWITLPETLPPRDPTLSETRTRASVPSRFRTLSRPSLESARGWLARNRGILAGDGLYLLSTFIGDGIVLSTLSLYLKQQYGEAITFEGLTLRIASMGGLLLGLRGLVAALTAPIAGYLSDQGGDRRVVSIAGAALGMTGMLLLAWSTAPGTLIAGVLLIALGGGTLGAVLPAWVGDLADPERRGAVLGGLMTAGDIGSAVAPLAVYSVLAQTSLRGIYTVSSLGLAVGIALIAWASQGPRTLKPTLRQLPETDRQS